MNKLSEEFKALKASENINGLIRLAAKVDRAGGRSSAVRGAIKLIINNKFTQAVNDISPILMAKQGIEIRVTPKLNNGYSTHFVALVKDGKEIAGMSCVVHVHMDGGRMSKELELASGWTLPNYSKNGPLRPSSGPGYGTILRAILVHVAKKLNFFAAIQDAAVVSAENKNKFARGIIKRPASAWIMNKLGFNIQSQNKVPGTNKIQSEHRVLRLNRNTPQLNAIVRNILGPAAVVSSRPRWSLPWTRPPRVQ
jgi:hypothetical protein